MKLNSTKQKLTPQEIDDFEKQHDFTLPTVYKKMMLENNGGYPEKKYFNGSLVYFLPINHGNWTLNKSMELTTIPALKKFVPFCDINEGFLALSLDFGENYGKIYQVGEDGEITSVADSIENFIDRLANEFEE